MAAQRQQFKFGTSVFTCTAAQVVQKFHLKTNANNQKKSNVIAAFMLHAYLIKRLLQLHAFGYDCYALLRSLREKGSEAFIAGNK